MARTPRRLNARKIAQKDQKHARQGYDQSHGHDEN